MALEESDSESVCESVLFELELGLDGLLSYFFFTCFSFEEYRSNLDDFRLPSRLYRFFFFLARYRLKR